MVRFMYRPYSNVRSFHRAASMDVQFVLPPHCSLWRPPCSAFFISFCAKRILSAVLKSALTKPNSAEFVYVLHSRRFLQHHVDAPHPSFVNEPKLEWHTHLDTEPLCKLILPSKALPDGIVHPQGYDGDGSGGFGIGRWCDGSVCISGTK